MRFLKMKNVNFIKQVLPNYLEKHMEEKHLMKNPNFILNHLMVLQNYILIGLHQFIEIHITCLRVTEYYLIMKVQEEEKLL